MADVLKENISEAVSSGTAKAPASPEGMAVAYGSLVIMALLPIFFGAIRSVKHKDNNSNEQEKKEVSPKDAAMFPLVASATLFGLYIVFQTFSKEHVNQLLTFYFFFLGVLALSHLVSPLVQKVVSGLIPNRSYHLSFTQRATEELEYLIDQRFTLYDVISFICCSIFGGWYLIKKHWIANNLFGIAFATKGVELLHLDKVETGCILLCGLFVYDIFWVFGTNVMVTVAKSFEAPIKLVFPQDILEKGLAASNFAMLGLGDIVIPGIFIALLLRFDNSLKRNSKFYFYSSFLAYILGLMATIFVMHVFKRAQPALLYLVPACLGIPMFLAVLRGDLKAMFKYKENSSEKEESKAGESTETKKEAKKKK